MIQVCDAVRVVMAVTLGVRARSNANSTPAVDREEAPLRASGRGCYE
jgi:hypothetical protein